LVIRREANGTAKVGRGGWVRRPTGKEKRYAPKKKIQVKLTDRRLFQFG